MAPPKGSQFWKRRSKHGRDKLFASAKLLLKASEEYFQWCDNNPLIEIDFRGKNAAKRELPKMRAYTIQGLSLYLGCNSQYLAQFEAQIKKSEKKKLKKKEREELNNFSLVITRIRDIIYTQKFEGAAAGFLNANIIARDLGLKDKAEVTNIEQPLLPD